MFNYVPFELPKTVDGEYIVCLDDAGILRSRREQLGLTMQQVADMAGIQFSQYQRLEAGERTLSGCSMRTGLSICAVLLLDPCTIVGVPLNLPGPEMLKPQISVDIDLSQVSISKKAGRKQIKRDVMTVYFNHSFYSIVIPQSVLMSLGKPNEIEFLWNKDKKRLLIHGIETPKDTSYDVPAHMYTDSTALVIPGLEFIENVKNVLCWGNDVYAVDCRMVHDKENKLYILCDLNTAHLSEAIRGPFAVPACIDNGLDE